MGNTRPPSGLNMKYVKAIISLNEDFKSNTYHDKKGKNKGLTQILVQIHSNQLS